MIRANLDEGHNPTSWSGFRLGSRLSAAEQAVRLSKPDHERMLVSETLRGLNPSHCM